MIFESKRPRSFPLAERNLLEFKLNIYISKLTINSAFDLIIAKYVPHRDLELNI